MPGDWTLFEPPVPVGRLQVPESSWYGPGCARSWTGTGDTGRRQASGPPASRADGEEQEPGEEYEVDAVLEEGSYRVGIFTGFGIAQGPEGT